MVKLQSRNKNLSIGLIVICLISMVLYGYYLHEKVYPSTENAYVNANLINVAPKVGGFLEKIYIKNNQLVKKGTLLVRINPIDFSLQLKQSIQARLAAIQEADYAKQHITTATANQARAQSEDHFSQQMAMRYTNLYKSKAGSLQDMQKYVNQANQARQALEQANSTLAQALMQYEIAKTKIATANINVRNARVNQSYTRLYAPVDGYVANLNLHEGQLVMAGQKLFGLVDDATWWVDANMKETQLRRIKASEHATVKLDMYDHRYTGRVQSISYASGSTFSLLPPENASGNWVKVIQYFTVRVSLKNNPDYPLRVGASARVTIDTLGVSNPSKNS